jgi:predicted nucleotidyltransferase
MALDATSIIDIIKDYVNDVRRVFSVDKAVLFGSYAKWTTDAQSDIDICFFLDNYGGKRRLDIIEELLGLIDNGEYFEPIVFPTSEIQNDNPFVKEILRTGVEIDL